MLLEISKVAISSSVSQTSMFHQAFELWENIFFVCLWINISTSFLEYLS